MKRFALPLLTVLVALAACVKTNVVRLGGPEQYVPVPAEQVQVYMSEEDVEVPFEKVAIIDSEGNYAFTDREKLIEEMKKKAGEIGANAIILQGFEDPSTGSKVASALVGVGGERKGKVLAIRLMESDP